MGSRLRRRLHKGEDPVDVEDLAATVFENPKVGAVGASSASEIVVQSRHALYTAHVDVVPPAIRKLSFQLTEKA